MKRKVYLSALALVFMMLGASTKSYADLNTLAQKQDVIAKFLNASQTESGEISLENFMELTPKKYKEITGERLGLVNTLKLKKAQKTFQKMSEGGDTVDFPKGAYIVLVIIGWGFLPMGLMDEWQGNNWWVNLLLTFLCWLPGVIHGLAKMKEYY